MSNLTKLGTTSLVCVWPVVILTSADSHGTLQLNLRVSALFWCGHFSSPEQFGAVVFKHSRAVGSGVLLAFLRSSSSGCLEAFLSSFATVVLSIPEWFVAVVFKRSSVAGSSCFKAFLSTFCSSCLQVFLSCIATIVFSTFLSSF